MSRTFEKLDEALDTDLMLSPVTAAVGLDAEGVDGIQCSAEMINQKAGNRCTIRYDIGLPDPTGDLRRVAVIGKHFAKTTKAAKAFRRLEDLRGHVVSSDALLVIPAPLTCLPELGIFLQEFRPGSDPREALSTDGGERPLSLAGKWLADLHGSPPLADLKLKSIERELKKTKRRIKKLAREFPSGKGSRLRQLESTVRVMADIVPNAPPTMIHRDFYHGNLLWDGTHLAILDFDQLAIGDPAMDVGHMLGQLACLAYRETGRSDAYALGAQAFAHSYSEHKPTEFGIRLPFFTAYTFIKLAYQAVDRKPEGWKEMASEFIELASAECERALGGTSQ